VMTLVACLLIYAHAELLFPFFFHNEDRFSSCLKSVQLID
jgi:hypothetical protein